MNSPSNKTKKSSRSGSKIGEKGLCLGGGSLKSETQGLQDANTEILRLNILLSDHNQRIADLENLIRNRNQVSPLEQENYIQGIKGNSHEFLRADYFPSISNSAPPLDHS